MKTKLNYKQVLLSLLGNCILGAGVAISSQAKLGTDPSVSFSQAVSSFYGISLGTMITITNVTLAIVVFFLCRKNLGLTTLGVVFLNQYPVDFFTSLIPHSQYLAINILYIIAGCILVAIGCNLMINSNLGMGIYDAFIFSLVEKFHIDFVYIRYITDAIFLALTFIFKGYIGIGTILSYLLTGNLMKYSKPYIDKIVKFN